MKKTATALDLSSAQWRISSFSSGANSNCVQVAGLHDAIAVRDSKDPQGTVLIVDTRAWGRFATAVKSGSATPSLKNQRPDAVVWQLAPRPLY